MILRSCSSVRRRLPDFCDGELPVGEQIEVQAHLRHCAACAAEVQELRDVGDALRAGAIEVRDDLGGLSATVVSRLKAERDESLPVRVSALFEDLHVVWAALSAAAATAACLAVMVGMFYFAARERPDSLAALLAAAAAPGSNANPVSVDGRMALPRALSDDTFTAPTIEGEGDAVFTLAAVVTREGRIANLELLRSNDRDRTFRTAVRREEVLNLLDTISRARFQPARLAGSPVAVNVVWLYAHLTVRGKLLVPESRTPARGAISQRTPLYPQVAV
jgi:hypothetical protein